MLTNKYKIPVTQDEKVLEAVMSDWFFKVTVRGYRRVERTDV